MEDAIKGSQTTAEKIEIETGVLGRDDRIGSDFIFFDRMTSTPFTLRFESDDTTNNYELDGQLSVTINLCQDELDRVNIAEHTIANIKGRIRQLHNAPESPRNEDEIARLQAALVAENAKLKAARKAHRLCLERFQILDDATEGTRPC
ncbi:MAG TPA: hypothetical protein VGJ95_22965 [Pseudonocardiaceae bacterium]